jgi:hypothetical protein
MKHKLSHLDKVPAFEKEIPQEVLDLISFFRKKKVACILVGGAVRDWVKDGVISPDLDFEIVPLDKITEKDWKMRISELFDDRFQKNDFMVHKIKIKRFDLEFAPARIEKYKSIQQEFNHSDFDVEYLLELDTSRSFKRRDFTCNAMGILFSPEGFEFIDPFNGMADMESKVLRACGDDFCKDPVRLLRVVRFSINMDFHYHKEMENIFSGFSLKHLSEYYFFKEAFKSKGIFPFFREVKKIVTQNNIETPEFFEYLEILDRDEDLTISNKKKLFFSLCFYEEDTDDVERFSRFLQLKKNFVNRWMRVFEFLNNINISSLKEIQSYEHFKKHELHGSFVVFYSKVKNLPWENDLQILEEIRPDIFEILKVVFSPETGEKSQDNQELASLPLEERKSYQAYQLLRRLSAISA